MSQFRSSRPDPWINPRPYSDPSLRYRAYGPIQPMERSGRPMSTKLFARLLKKVV